MFDCGDCSAGMPEEENCPCGRGFSEGGTVIRVVCADISSADDRIYRSLYEKASPQRKLRADRYLRQEDKLRCVTAAALLKTVLGAEDDRIGQNEFGKPYLKDREDLHYNLSHSGRYVVLAWGDTAVGVDVQRHDADANTQAIGKRFFTSDELQYIRGNRNRFYEIWTKKESYLKYTGKGLRAGLDSFSVLAPERKIRYFYRTLETDYSLSLCTEADAWELELLDVQQLL
jgi:4'-phosphopantetheinyl transferase